MKNQIDRVGEINAELVKLWRNPKYKNIEKVWAPYFVPPIRQKTILFVSLNPSLAKDFADLYHKKLSDKDSYPEHIPELKYKDFKAEETLKWENFPTNNTMDFYIDQLQGAEGVMRFAYKQFFGVFDKICEKARGNPYEWEHVDLFFYRETNQDKIKDIIFLNEKGSKHPEPSWSKSEIEAYKKNMHPFANEQINLSKELIELANPKVIVVANKVASDIFMVEYSPSWNDEYGYWEATINNRSVPVFLCSMLSGQRALDIYSRRQLIWHIKRAIKQY
jgi:hypothetical protein